FVDPALEGGALLVARVAEGGRRIADDRPVGRPHLDEGLGSDGIDRERARGRERVGVPRQVDGANPEEVLALAQLRGRVLRGRRVLGIRRGVVALHPGAVVEAALEARPSFVAPIREGRRRGEDDLTVYGSALDGG